MKKVKARIPIKAEELAKMLSEYRIELDCGHHASIGHNFANTVVILETGKMICHNCYD